ncbi:MAG: hypothetical protein JWM19_10 [Actinomycetia bacterium]|nr:hypothetical protein [Actinomycetes bacterium]
MIIRWISDVPSKMVKILAVGAVSAGQRPARTPVVSARIQHALSETNSGFGPIPCVIGARGADALQSADEGGQEVGGCPRRRSVRGSGTAGTSEVYSGADLAVSLPSRYPRGQRRAAGPHADRTAGMLSCDQAEVVTFGAGRPWPPARLPCTGYAVRGRHLIHWQALVPGVLIDDLMVVHGCAVGTRVPSALSKAGASMPNKASSSALKW